MSSDEGSDDGEGRIRFTTDGDYEDGQWIDGEFMARGLRQGRTQTREEQLYGVFHEEGLDGTEGGGGRRRGGGARGGGGGGGGRSGSGGGAKKGPVSFVSSSSKPAPPTARDQQQTESKTKIVVGSVVSDDHTPLARTPACELLATTLME